MCVFCCLEARLTKSELLLITKKFWLNDNCIEFWGQVLFSMYSEVHKNTIILSPTASFTLLHLERSALLTNTENNIYMKVNDFKVKYLFLPLISNADSLKGGGSHWSLLFCVRKVNKLCCYHFDSSARTNSSIAETSAQALKKIFNDEIEIEFQNQICSQQTNSYDCGVYVGAFFEVLLCRIASKHDENYLSPITLSEEKMSKYRNYMESKILSCSTIPNKPMGN